MLRALFSVSDLYQCVSQRVSKVMSMYFGNRGFLLTFWIPAFAGMTGGGMGLMVLINFMGYRG